MSAPMLLLNGAPYVSLPDLARLRGVSRMAVWLAVKEKRLAHRKIGRRLYVPWLDAMAWRPRGATPPRRGGDD